MLHTLSHSPWKSDIEILLCMLHNNDDLLLLQDGVLAAVNNNYYIQILDNILTTVFALKEDIEARGLLTHISSKVTIINYIEFVDLTIKHCNQMNW